MDNTNFLDLKNKLAVLPVLEERRKSLTNRLYQAEEEVKSLLRKYQQEALDVDEIQKDSLSHTILKLIGKYEGKVTKETQEMLSAKLEYDKAVERVKQLKQEQLELANKISELNKEKKVFDDEFRKRESLIQSKISEQAYIDYSELENRQNNFRRQLVETEEALGAASRVITAASNAADHLRSAENWATYDVWGGRGILSHMAKYDHIDDAQAQLNRLGSLIKDFEKELKDVNMYEVCAYTGIDSTTRTIDFWFDNIFTDLSVRDKIRDDMSQVQRIIGQVTAVQRKLESNKTELKRKMAEAESSKNKLIMDFDGIQS